MEKGGELPAKGSGGFVRKVVWKMHLSKKGKAVHGKKGEMVLNTQ